ncbi:tail endopeptidase [Bacillus phage vB_BanS_Skywalker]|uniref:Tail endopeptidase n=2 Tax=Tsamsavirus TaxID=3044849 RepID=A0AAE8YVD8_9CAUD|nr:tail endopeptidase [Bacillus phage vB_BanS_Skywalker]YP_010681091.1 tail endopeptidase [Bacillus phage vB_BanS_MrDarsey]UGO48027.1 tail endopeptidase [Bacillus phage vB_BanS_MrDarsey]UGO51231.1 tail endopeptidase [Bacillus phage vB_BanS_Skywalker]
MFIDIDYNKRLQEAKFHLAKPNKQIVSHIYERIGGEMSIKLGNINELSFSIPHFIEDQEPNPHVDSIKEMMLIRVTMGSYKEWYVVNEIEEDGDDSDIFNVKAFSLGYELKGKQVSDYTEDAINATDLLTKLLENTVWKIGTVDAMFDVMFRSFDSGSDSNVLDCIIQAGETFGALLVWDTETRKVSFKDMSQNGTFKGMTVNYGRFLQSIKRTRTTDELTTRLYIYGSEDLSIHGVNPTGQPYIEDFSYFLYPFERDANKNVIKESYFMSNELCHAILNQQIMIAQNAPQIKSLTDDMLAKETLLLTGETQLTELEGQLKTIQGLLDTAKATENATLITQRQLELNNKEAEITAKRQANDIIKNQVQSYKNQIDALQDQIATGSGFTPQLLDELNLFIHEMKWVDDKYIDAKELYQDGLKKFEELRQPKVVIDVTIDNLMNIIEEQYYWDKLVLGDLIKVKYPQMKIEYMAKIIEIKYDLENNEASITVANTKDILSDTEKLVQLLYSNSSASSLVQANKYKWDKVNKIEDVVSNIVTSEWDATKNKIIAGVNNSIEIGNRGMIVTSPDNPNEVVIIQSGVIALSQDKGETWKTAIKPDGIVAERLIGQIIAGENLILTNSAGSFTFDKNGVRIDASAFILESSSGRFDGSKFIDSANFVDEFKDDNMITAYEKKMLKQEWDKYEIAYNKNTGQDGKIHHVFPNDGEGLQFVADYHARYTELYDYLFVQLHGDKPLLDPSNMTFTTRIDRNMFDARWKNFSTAQEELQKQIDIMVAQIARDAKTVAENIQTDIEEVKNDVVYKIEFHSTKGFTFKNGQIDTDITARVFRGQSEITDTILPSGFIWTKYDKDGVLDTAWSNAHVGVGNKISVTAVDVNQKAIFKCEINKD